MRTVSVTRKRAARFPDGGVEFPSMPPSRRDSHLFVNTLRSTETSRSGASVLPRHGPPTRSAAAPLSMRYRSWALTRHRGGDEGFDLLRRLEKVRGGKVGVTRRRLLLRLTQQLPKGREALAGRKPSFQAAFRELPVL